MQLATARIAAVIKSLSMYIQDLLGIELPIIQAPMAGVQDSKLTVAVCEAGGLGSLPCAMLGPEALTSEIARIQAQTSRPFNLNFFCHTPPEPDPVSESRWQQALKPYYEEMGLDIDATVPGPGRSPFTLETAELLAHIEPPVVSFHFGLPADDLLARVRSWGAKILASATTVDEAKWLEARGVDAIIAQGTEAGGHRGHFLSNDLSIQLPTASLVAKIVATIKVPVIAAGGISTANDVADVMQLGAAGVQVGTAYLLCPEATTRPLHRAALVSESAGDTAITNVFSGRPARGIVNRLIREQGPISQIAPQFPLAANALGPLRAEAEKRGSGDFTPLWAGQNIAGCREVSAGTLTRELAALL
jgi:nitronate monooxygenase